MLVLLFVVMHFAIVPSCCYLSELRYLAKVLGFRVTTTTSVVNNRRGSVSVNDSVVTQTLVPHGPITAGRHSNIVSNHFGL